jgi:hypothetical protein
MVPELLIIYQFGPKLSFFFLHFFKKVGGLNWCTNDSLGTIWYIFIVYGPNWRVIVSSGTKLKVYSVILVGKTYGGHKDISLCAS